ncbi:MAG: C-GCAxxG-C-C family protein [Anaerovoracaceae bacterium]|jgi:C_GCAxxG_C_C family probable redox protein
MSEKRENQAVKNKDLMNCCQSVLLAYADDLGKSKSELLQLGSGFGSGMGGQKATCGALVGAVIAANLLKGEDRHQAKETSSAMLDEFESLVGATICGDIKREETGDPLCSCEDCVRYAVRVLDKRL